MDILIKSVGTPTNPRFMVNDKVIIHSFTVDSENDQQIKYSFDYDDQLINEADAIVLAEKSVEKMVNDISVNYQKSIDDIEKGKRDE